MAASRRFMRPRAERPLRVCLLGGVIVALAATSASAAPPAGYEAAAQKAVHRAFAQTAARARLPLRPGAPLRVSAARAGADRRALAARTTPARVLVAARAHADVPGLARDLRRFGTEVEVLDRIGVIALRARSPAALVAALGDDARVAAIEPDRIRRAAADPADALDPRTGTPFGWAFAAVRAGEALAEVGGGSAKLVAVIDTGVDEGHPDLAGQIAGTYDSAAHSRDATDRDGHGTFVTGLIAMGNDNGIGGRGVAGRTRILAIRADDGLGGFSTLSLLRAGEVAIETGSDILNLSLGGEELTESEARQLEFAYLSDVLPVAAAGNSGEEGNPLEYPAAALGGYRGRVGIGLSVGAVRPNGMPAAFSTHNNFVSLAAPGAGVHGCDDGVFSTVPGYLIRMFDAGEGCAPLFAAGFGSGRYGYSEGTSFAAPIVSAVAALVWEAEPRLQSEQVGDVLMRTARQTYGTARWNRRTGRGIVDALAAVREARRYDILPPRFSTRVRRAGKRYRVRVYAGKDRAHRGDRKAGGVRYSLIERSRTTDRFIVRSSRRAIARTIIRRRGRSYVAAACDANGNCAVRKLRLR